MSVSTWSSGSTKSGVSSEGSADSESTAISDLSPPSEYPGTPFLHNGPRFRLQRELRKAICWYKEEIKKKKCTKDASTASDESKSTVDSDLYSDLSKESKVKRKGVKPSKDTKVTAKKDYTERKAILNNDGKRKDVKPSKDTKVTAKKDSTDRKASLDCDGKRKDVKPSKDTKVTAKKDSTERKAILNNDGKRKDVKPSKDTKKVADKKDTKKATKKEDTKVPVADKKDIQIFVFADKNVPDSSHSVPDSSYSVPDSSHVAVTSTADDNITIADDRDDSALVTLLASLYGVSAREMARNPQKVIDGFTIRKTFKIMAKDANKTLIFTVYKESCCCCENYCNKMKAVKFHFYDTGGLECFVATRPCKCGICFFPNYCCICAECCTDSVEVIGYDGELYGVIREHWGLLRPTYSIYNRWGSYEYDLIGQCCWFTCPCACLCTKTKFKITNTTDGSVVGGVFKQQGATTAKEDYGRDDTFGVDIPYYAEPKMKAVMISALFLIDMVHFETTSAQNMRL